MNNNYIAQSLLIYNISDLMSYVRTKSITIQNELINPVFLFQEKDTDFLKNILFGKSETKVLTVKRIYTPESHFYFKNEEPEFIQAIIWDAYIREHGINKALESILSETEYCDFMISDEVYQNGIENRFYSYKFILDMI
jgi:hypothetical protein